MVQKPQARLIPLDQIEISPHNVRHTQVEKGLDELANSIREYGVLQPVIVYRPQKSGKYQLLVGQRRYLASGKAGETDIPALVLGPQDETRAAIISLSENIHRLDLDYVDKMAIATKLVEALESRRKVANALGVSLSTVYNWLGYAAVPPGVKSLVDEGRLGAVTAIRIARHEEDPDRAAQIAKLVVEQPTSARKDLFIDVAKANPRKELSEVAEIVASQRFDSITLHLTPVLREALDKACQKFDSVREDLAVRALEDWLGMNGFLP